MDELMKIIDRYTEGNYLIGKATKEEMAKDIFSLLDVIVPKGTLCDLDGKKVMVKFKVTKYIPKIFIEDI